MTFNSIDFILFLIAVVVVYYLIPNNRVRKIFLLAASYYFYCCWNVAFLVVLLLVTLLSYGTGLCYRNDGSKRDRKVMVVSIVLLLCPLVCFKYLDFFFRSFGDLVSLVGCRMQVPQFKLLLPVGISYYSFMSISYVVDVYKQKIAPERDALDYALFLGFFPQITSGPIGRAPLLLPQLKEKHPLLYENIASGCKMMLWGFFMKMVVADRAGIYVDTIFGNYAQRNGSSLMLATFMYTIQIYCDFAGYSMIAMGAAKTMGYELINNFQRPYFAKSVGEFWRRWHISLSTWFRDYVYIPLGGNRRGKGRMYLNLLIVFLVSGLWHGAGYTFVVWGLLHAIALIIDKATKTFRNQIWTRMGVKENAAVRQVLSIIVTFVIVCYLRIIYYAPCLGAALGITKRYFHGGAPSVHPTTLVLFGFGFLILLLKDLKDEYLPEKHWFLYSKRIWVRYLSFISLAAIVVLCGVIGGGQFIYMMF